MALAEHGTLDGLSVGVDFDMAADTVPDEKNQGTVRVRRADLRETSITAVPAFDDARIAKVRAQRDGGSGMPEKDELNTAQTQPPAAGGVNLNQDQLTALLQRPGAIQALVASQQTPQQPAARRAR
ncbi:HK97 family phage prohead protease [Micromonospora sp. M12]